MLNLHLDVNNNTASWGQQTVEFRRANSAMFLQRLLANALRGMSTDLADLQFAANKTHTDQTTDMFGRQQIARLVKEIDAFFHDNPELGLTFLLTNRKLTVGPWRVAMASPISISPLPTIEQWNYPTLIDGLNIEQLRVLLAQWLTFEGFAAYGEHGSALEMISGLSSVGLLTVEAQSLLQLRRIYFMRRLGQYDAALELTVKLQQHASNSKDVRLAGQLQLSLARIEYERDPPARWRQARAVMAEPPAVVAPCALTHSEWHNLYALCSRRAALEAFEAGDRTLAIAQHESAFRHFQSAMYFCLSLQLWDRVHAFIDNFCYHLQKMYEHQVVPIQEVLDWYALALACADKLDSGHDDAWDLIYFAEFYLDHAEQINQAQKLFSHRSSLLHDRYSPNRQDFWDGALGRARTIGGARQLAITLVLYLRWMLVHSPNLNGAISVWSLKLELNALLEQNSTLGAQLCDDGYDGWLQRVTLN
jgi:hypothetical protein